MRRAPLIALTVITALLVYVTTRGLPGAARVWTTILVATLPPISVAQARALAHVELPSRMSLYAQTSLSLWLLAAATAAVAFVSDMGARELGLLALPLASTLVWTGTLTLGGVGLMLLAHRLGVRESPTLAGLLPHTAAERLAFLGVSITAGVCEEFVFRGFLVPAIGVAVGSPLVAALIAAAVFGLLHAYQGFSGALRAALLGALLSVVLLTTGSIVPAVLAHALIDVVGGFWLGPRLVRQDGA